jgi:excisionase family DNA binding protein
MSLEDSFRAVVREEVQRIVREELRTALAEIRLPGSGDADQYLSTERAAALAGVHPDTIRSWVKAGQLPEHRAGRELRIRGDELRRFLDAHNTETNRPSAEEEASTILARRRLG